MSDLSALRFFSTAAHPCSYLDGQQAKTLFLDPHTPVDATLYTQLSLLGFRRSGEHLYRPHCDHCQACIPARIPVNAFINKRRFRRIWKKNEELVIRPLPAELQTETYQLYARYISEKHAQGDMYPPSEDQFSNFLLSSWGCTQFYGFFLKGTLVAVCVIDVLLNGLSAVYTFYDPDLSQRSLGTFSILWQIEHAKASGLPYLYLGYWVRQCRKMAYKGEFAPLEIFNGQRWVMHTPE